MTTEQATTLWPINPIIQPTTTPTPRGLCSQTFASGITWPEAREGIISRPCPGGSIGYATWECKMIGNGFAYGPGAVDMSSCRHQWIADLQSAVDSDSESMNLAERTQAAKMLLKGLTDEQTLRTSGDIVTAVDVALKLLAPLEFIDMRSMTRTELSTVPHITNDIGQVSDVLLSSSTSTWEGMPDHTRSQTMTRLIQGLDDSAQLLTKFLANQNPQPLKDETIVFQNFEMQMQVISEPMNDSPHRTLLPAQINQQNNMDNHQVQFRGSTSSMKLPSVGVIKSSLPQVQYSESVMSAAPVGVMSASPGNLGPIQDVPRPAARRTNDVRIGYVTFNNLTQLLSPRDSNSVVNSAVVSATVNNAHESLQLPEDSPVEFTFDYIRKHNIANVRCVWWNTREHTWDESGCWMSSNTSTSSTCQCSHLTSFTILVDLTDFTETGRSVHVYPLDVITKIGLSISAGCLAVSVIVFTFIRQLWCARNTIHRNLCLCLLVGNLLFLFGMERTENVIGCMVIAIAVHYLFLASFMWMAIEGYQLYLMLVRVFDRSNSKYRRLVYYLIGYVAPAIVVAISAGIWPDDYGTQTYCFTRSRTPAMWLFVGPVVAVMAVNLTFLAVAFKVVFGVKAGPKANMYAKVKGWLKGSSMLLCLLGLTWAFGFGLLLTPVGLNIAFAYVFTILNSLQGVFIFVFHVVMNDKVRSALVKWARHNCTWCMPRVSDSTFNSANSNQQILDKKQKKRRDAKMSSSDDAFNTNSTATTDSQPNSHIYTLPSWPLDQDADENEENMKRERKLMEMAQQRFSSPPHVYDMLTPPSVMYNRGINGNDTHQYESIDQYHNKSSPPPKYSVD